MFSFCRHWQILVVSIGVFPLETKTYRSSSFSTFSEILEKFSSYVLAILLSCRIYPTVGLNVHFMMTNEDEHIFKLVFWPFRHIPSLVLVLVWVFGPFLLTNRILYIFRVWFLCQICVLWTSSPTSNIFFPLLFLNYLLL